MPGLASLAGCERDFGPASSSKAGSDRRGQAPKGTGGMPRRHQMVGVLAAKSSGELPTKR